jgi:hypothetical protein
MTKRFNAGSARFAWKTEEPSELLVSFKLGDREREMISGRRTLCPAIAAATPGDLTDNNDRIPQMLLMLGSEEIVASVEVCLDRHTRASERQGMILILESKVHAGSL